jgi:hypothetical protein
VTLAPGSACGSARAGKALTGRVGLVEGQDLMKGAARVKTSLRSRGTCGV